MSMLQGGILKEGSCMGAGWAIKANFPNLNSGRVFRLDWFIVFLEFVTISLISLASISKLIPQVLAAH
jgi:hypothetical protein